MESAAALRNDALWTWVDDMVALCTPDEVHWCEGTVEE